MLSAPNVSTPFLVHTRNPLTIAIDECREKTCVKHKVPDKPYCNSRKFDRFMTFLPTRANLNLDCCTEQDCLSARDHDTRCGTLCYTRKLPISFLPWHMLTSIRSPTASRKSSRRGKANRTPTQRRSIQRSSRRSPPPSSKA
jgi:hypothetical protein